VSRVLEVMADVRPDVVFSDVAIPEMDGFEVADAMRARPELAHIPIVLMAELRARVAPFSGS
jgi:CheY-like chemotaxis protein